MSANQKPSLAPTHTIRILRRNEDDAKQTSELLRSERLQSDTRQLGGLLLVLGVCATFGALADVAANVGPGGSTASEGIPMWFLIAGCLQAFFGTVAMFVGFNAAVNDWGDRLLTAFLIAVTQLAYVPFLTTLTALGRGARSDPQEAVFIPLGYNPTSTDVRFVGAMGVLSILAYGTAYLGSLGFMEFSLYAYQAGKMSDRSSSYFRGRSTLYNGLVVLAGFTQLALGAYIISRFGGGSLLENGPINVGLYTVFFPEISVAVGLVQMLVGTVGVFRSKGKLLGGRKDIHFQFACFLMWLFMLSIQLMVQVAYAPGDILVFAAPTRACIIFGLAFMPAFLDAKANNTPSEEHMKVRYGVKEEEKEMFDAQNVKVESLTRVESV